MQIAFCNPREISLYSFFGYERAEKEREKEKERFDTMRDKVE